MFFSEMYSDLLLNNFNPNVKMLIQLKLVNQNEVY